VGDRRAARIDGEPGGGADRDCGAEAAAEREDGEDGRLVLGLGVDRCDGDSQRGPDDAAIAPKQQRFGEGLCGDVATGCAEGAAQSDLRSGLSTEMTITLAIPTPPTRRRPRSRSDVNAFSAAALAASVSNGRETSVSSGCSWLAVATTRSRTANLNKYR
jgi:hypothetical protein